MLETVGLSLNVLLKNYLTGGNMKKTLLAICTAIALPVSAQHIDYVDDVAEIINNKCLVCHRQGGIGPMSFEGYEQVKPWSPLIAYKVANKEMPPYAYDDHIGI